MPPCKPNYSFNINLMDTIFQIIPNRDMFHFMPLQNPYFHPISYKIVTSGYAMD
jgi:hypothetical protein